MKAAVVSDFSAPPTFGDFPDPTATSGFVEVSMLAAGVHQLVRSTAAGKHYSSGDRLPFVAGTDGIALLDGKRVYTGACPHPLGTLAERTLVPTGWAIPVPDNVPTALAAAIVNPAMSSWMPLVSRGIQRDQTVLVLGATGVSGSLAVRVALELGAGRVLAAGRSATALDQLAEDPRVTAISLVGSPEEITDRISAATADGVDFVLDYLWGPIAEATLDAFRSGSLRHGGSAIEYVQIGALAGRTTALDASILRARRITISGSGGGSIDPRSMLAEVPKLFTAVAAGTLTTNVRVAPLEDVAAAWTSELGGRLVISLT